MATFGRLTDFTNKALTLDSSGLFFHVFSEDDVQSYIIFLNTQKQLFEKGIDANGKSLESIGGSYAPFTVLVKTSVGQPTDRVTLEDTGQFYSSFTVDVQSNEFVIEAYYIKDGEDLRDRWGDNIAGLTDSSKNALIEMILPKCREFLLNYMLNE